MELAGDVACCATNIRKDVVQEIVFAVNILTRMDKKFHVLLCQEELTRSFSKCEAAIAKINGRA